MRGLSGRDRWSWINKEISMEIIKDLWNFLRERKKFWLLPVIISLLLIGILILISASSPVAPFIYTLF